MFISKCNQLFGILAPWKRIALQRQTTQGEMVNKEFIFNRVNTTLYISFTGVLCIVLCVSQIDLSRAHLSFPAVGCKVCSSVKTRFTFHLYVYPDLILSGHDIYRHIRGEYTSLHSLLSFIFMSSSLAFLQNFEYMSWFCVHMCEYVFLVFEIWCVCLFMEIRLIIIK